MKSMGRLRGHRGNRPFQHPGPAPRRSQPDASNRDPLGGSGIRSTRGMALLMVVVALAILFSLSLPFLLSVTAEGQIGRAHV
mgnify:CR=1 FL=1